MKIIITKATESLNVKERQAAWKPQERKKQDVIYVWLEGENVLKNLMNRRDRPSKAYKEFVLPLGLKELGYTEEEAKAIIKKAYWSQKAGCRCGCSPGFLTKGMKEGEAHITFAGVNEEEIKDAKELVN
jgi:hypothetical protein